METILSILFFIFPFLAKYFYRPKLSVSITTKAKGTIDNVQDIYVKHNWDVFLNIFNKTEHAAILKNIKFSNESPKFKMEKFNVQILIDVNNPFELKINYSSKSNYVDGKMPSQKLYPKEFDTLKVLISYKNLKGRTFYTIYSFKNRKNSFCYKKPNLN